MSLLAIMIIQQPSLRSTTLMINHGPVAIAFNIRQRRLQMML